MIGSIQHLKPTLVSKGSTSKQAEAEASHKRSLDEVNRSSSDHSMGNAKDEPQKVSESDIRRNPGAPNASKPSSEKGEEMTMKHHAEGLPGDFPETIFTPNAFALFRLTFEAACHASDTTHSQQRKLLLRHIKHQAQAAVKRIPSEWSNDEIMDYIEQRVKGAAGEPSTAVPAGTPGDVTTSVTAESTPPEPEPTTSPPVSNPHGMAIPTRRTDDFPHISEYWYLYRMLNAKCKSHLDDSGRHREMSDVILSLAQFVKENGRGTQWEEKQLTATPMNGILSRRVIDCAIDALNANIPSAPPPEAKAGRDLEVGIDNSCRRPDTRRVTLDDEETSDPPPSIQRSAKPQKKKVGLRKCACNHSHLPSLVRPNADEFERQRAIQAERRKRKKITAEEQRVKQNRLQIKRLTERLDNCEVQLRARSLLSANAKLYVNRGSQDPMPSDLQCNIDPLPHYSEFTDMPQPPRPRWTACM